MGDHVPHDRAEPAKERVLPLPAVAREGLEAARQGFLHDLLRRELSPQRKSHTRSRQRLETDAVERRQLAEGGRVTALRSADQILD